MIAWYTDRDGLCVDGERWHSLPRGAEWSGRTVYVVGSAPWGALGARYLETGRDGDVLTAPWRGKPTGLRWETDGPRPAVLAPGDAWGLSDQPDDAAEELQARREAVEEEGLSWAGTASGVAAVLARSVLKHALRQLRPRWRTLARAAFHAGPQVALGGGCADAVELDRVGAYLMGLAAPLPIPGTWHGLEPSPPWAQVRRWPGLVLAAVDVLKPAGALGPLPVRTLAGTAWPVGRVWGAWQVEWLREAEEAGEVRVRRVLDAQLCRVSAWATPLAERIAAVADKPLRKLLYTRAYGLFAARGRWTAPRPAAIGPTGDLVRAHVTDEWSWTWTGGGDLDHRHSPLYRPDVAAYVAADNARAVLRGLRALPAGAAQLVHVDAVWAPAEHAAAVLAQGGWAVKHRGPLRVYGGGTYEHAGRARAQGAPGAHDPLILRDLVSHRAAGVSASDVLRSWPAGLPSSTPNAWSEPCPVALGQLVAHTPTWRREAWGAGGWLARGIEEDGLLRVTLDTDPDATAARRARLAAERDEVEQLQQRRAVAAARAEALRLALRAKYGPGVDG